MSTSLWQPRYRCGRMRVGPVLVTGRQGCEMQEGTSVDLPSHRPGNRWQNSENPPAEKEPHRERHRLFVRSGLFYRFMFRQRKQRKTGSEPVIIPVCVLSLAALALQNYTKSTKKKKMKVKLSGKKW